MTRTAQREPTSMDTPEMLCRRVRNLAMREPEVDSASRVVLFKELHEIELLVDRLSFRSAANVLDLTAGSDLVVCEQRLRELEHRWSLNAAPSMAA